jgi:hypothetical protein
MKACPPRQRCSVASRIVLLSMVAVLWPRAAWAEALLLRVFFLDGSSLVSYGEYARVGDRVVVSLPLGPLSESPRLHVVSLPAAQVDWGRTERYARAVRRAHYATTRGPADFAALETELGELLTAVGRETDPDQRLAVAERARQRLLEYAGAEHGYRVEQVREMAALVDEIVAGLRAASGARQFNLQLVARAEPPLEPLGSPPSLQELIAHVLVAARLSLVPAERLSLLESARGLLRTHRAVLPADWAARTRRAAEQALEAEWRIERAYRALAARTLAQASVAAARGEVTRIERAIESLLRRDRQLGGGRPEETSALLATLEAKLRAAQQRRLAYDRWRWRLPALRAYEAALAPALDLFRRACPSLEQIRRLAGPAMTSLVRTERQVAEAQAHWGRPTPPLELTTAHDLFGRALALAREAVRLRQRAVDTGDLETARDASSAAAGSLMLFERARADLARALAPPTGP